uniref:Uncharacterized protein n=1 Tax=Ditylenchus dipsaci TaxID=166011 RepID=A0A915DRS7_9BILA
MVKLLVLSLLVALTSATPPHSPTDKVVEKSIFHVGMMVSATEIVHATTEGVKKELLTEAVKSHKPNEVELTSVNLDEDWKNAAVEWANNEIGADYNDIFSPDFINSKAKRSFYCCQFVQEAYKQTKPDDQEDAFPEHTLNFKDKDGKLIDHFKKHYEEKNLPIPQDVKGSHPSKQHTAAFIKHVETVKIVH